jgi:hypothetical protein
MKLKLSNICSLCRWFSTQPLSTWQSQK